MIKYFFLLLLIICFTVNCNQKQDSAVNQNLIVSKPNVNTTIDSSLFYNEIKRLDSLFKQLYAANAFNGNVLVAKGKNIIYQKSFGYGNKATNQFLNDTSLFQLASVSKVFTAIGTLLLYEKGMLDLDEKVSKILSDFPYQNITIRNLLSHRAGLPNYTYFCNKYSITSQKECISNADLLEVLKKHKPELYFNPNYRFNYSNTNYAILALVIEKISGKSYSDYMKEELFIPLGMNHTFTALSVDSMNQLLTNGYTINYQPVANDKYDGILGDKGIYSTTYDLFLMSTALYQGKLLTHHTQNLAYLPHSKERIQSNYGLGWRMKNTSNANKEVFHNGWWHGYRTAFHRRLRDSVTIIVLSNRLNKSVYATQHIYAAIDGAGAFTQNESEEE